MALNSRFQNSKKELTEIIKDAFQKNNIAANVYFVVPNNVQMKYPCLKIDVNNIQNRMADDRVYNQNVSYKLTVITTKKFDELVDTVSQLPKTVFNTTYTSNNLYHYVFIMTL